MSDSEQAQRARVMRCAEMTKRALDRKDQASVNNWVHQFKIEVRRLCEIKDGAK